MGDLLLDDRTLKNEGGDHYTMPFMGFSVSVKVLGISNLSLAVNEDGYLQTSLISTGASYFIGKEKAQAFLDYVFAHGEAAEWPPAYADDAGVPERDSDAAQSAPSRPPATPEEPTIAAR